MNDNYLLTGTRWDVQDPLSGHDQYTKATLNAEMKSKLPNDFEGQGQ